MFGGLGEIGIPGVVCCLGAIFILAVAAVIFFVMKRSRDNQVGPEQFPPANVRSECGQENPVGNAFCERCGSILSAQ